MRILSALWLTFSLIIYCYLIPTWLASTTINYLDFNSLKDLQALAYAGATCLYPIVLLFMELLAWKAFGLHQYGRAMIFAAVPSLLIIFIWGYLFHFNLEFWWPWSYR